MTTKTYVIGETIIHVVPPDITEEERTRRIQETKQLIHLLHSQLHQKSELVRGGELSVRTDRESV